MKDWIRRRCVVLAGLYLILGVAQAEAHDVWITTEQDSGGNVYALVHHGHPGDRRNPDADKLFDFTVVGNRGPSRSLLVGIKPTLRGGLPVLKTAPLFLSSGTGVVILAANYDNGYWVRTADGHRNTSRRQIPNAEDSLYSMKYAKALVQKDSKATDGYQRRLGHRLELVPLDNPFLAKPGEGLQVRVYFDGKPLVGTEVEIGDGITPIEEKEIPRYKTDNQGVAVIPVSKWGLQLLVVDHIIPSTHPELAERELYNATLSFVLPAK